MHVNSGMRKHWLQGVTTAMNYKALGGKNNLIKNK